MAAGRHEAELGRELVDELARRGVFRTPQVEAAFRAVPRRPFLPGVPAAEAYGREPVVIRRDEAGRALASASAPDLVATMLELLEVRPGHRVMEIGTATGINAALLAELVGAGGQVASVEIDAGLADGARRALAATGHADRVTVVTGDGALGHPGAAPYDRIVVTAGAWDLPPAWWRQLAPDGRLVVPLRLHGSGLTRVLPLDRVADAMVATSAVVCGFVPLQGADAHPEDAVGLGEGAVLAVDADDAPDRDGLAVALAAAPRLLLPGVVLRRGDRADHLDLWLATHAAPTAFGRLTVADRLREAGVDPAHRWGGAALYADDALAHLVTRDVGDGVELGVGAHGRDRTGVAGHLADLLRRWGDTRPDQPLVTARPATGGGVSPDDSRGDSGDDFRDDCGPDATEIVRPHTRLTVAW